MINPVIFSGVMQHRTNFNNMRAGFPYRHHPEGLWGWVTLPSNSALRGAVRSAFRGAFRGAPTCSYNHDWGKGAWHHIIRRNQQNRLFRPTKYQQCDRGHSNAIISIFILCPHAVMPPPPGRANSTSIVLCYHYCRYGCPCHAWLSRHRLG